MGQRGMGLTVAVGPSFDVFSPGKLLWSMLSGSRFLRLWYFDKPEFNVEVMFPENRAMRWATRHPSRSASLKTRSIVVFLMRKTPNRRLTRPSRQWATATSSTERRRIHLSAAASVESACLHACEFPTLVRTWCSTARTAGASTDQGCQRQAPGLGVSNPRHDSAGGRCWCQAESAPARASISHRQLADNAPDPPKWAKGYVKAPSGVGGGCRGRGTSQWTRSRIPALSAKNQGGGLARICFRERRFTE